MARTALEEALLSGVNPHAGQKHTDGTFPHNFWVTPNGNDGVGNGSNGAGFSSIKRAIRQAKDGRGDRIMLAMGSYAETIDIGTGTSDGNISGGYAKKNLQIIGDDTVHNGLVQIVGDGVTNAPTLRVNGGYLRGFVLKNVELDVTTVTQPALSLITDDAAAAPDAISPYYRFHIENVAVRSNNPSVGFLLAGATLGSIKRCTVQGPIIGIGFCGSLSNRPSDLDLYDISFRDNVTADLATVSSVTNPSILGPCDLTNVTFERMKHWDRGGTPVTDFINMVGTFINVHAFDCFWARDVADGTLTQLPANMVIVGHSGAGVESVIGT